MEGQTDGMDALTPSKLYPSDFIENENVYFIYPNKD